jgi:branched-chain amino acid transport system ATP-binding protein
VVDDANVTQEQAMLRIEGLCKRFGQVTVASDLNLITPRCGCVGVIGPNGAGKTTLFNLIDGSIAPDSGRIELDGVDVTAMPQFRRAQLGIARAYQIPQPFQALTVYENVLVAATFAARLPNAAAERLALEVLERTGLATKAARAAGALPLLDRKRLELARAIAARPKLLMLDEIAGGLTEPEVHELVILIRSLKADHSVIWIEHVAHALTATADSLIVLNFGAKIAEGDPKATLKDPIVQRTYLGIDADAIA